MDTKQFQKKNESFCCISCRHTVEPHPTSSRDHCNNCLFGLHVDINPGDRLNDCRGVLEPIGIRQKDGKRQIVYKCQKCTKTTFCIEAPDDNTDKIIALSTRVWNDE